MNPPGTASTVPVELEVLSPQTIVAVKLAVVADGSVLVKPATVPWNGSFVVAVNVAPVAVSE